MPVAETAIDIDASPERVWQIMIDLPGYAAWNPFVVRADCDGPLVVGARLRLHVRWHDGGGARSGEIVTELAPPGEGPARLAYRFTGPLAALGLVRATRVQELTPLPGGRCRYGTREHFAGLLAGFVPLARVQEGFRRHAAALKAHAEGG